MSESNDPISQMIAIAATVRGKVVAAIHTMTPGKSGSAYVNVSVIFTDATQLSISGAEMAVLYFDPAQAKEKKG